MDLKQEGISFIKNKEYFKALNCFDTLIDQEPSSENFYYGALVRYHSAISEKDPMMFLGAKDYISQALKKEPSSVDSQLLLTKIFIAQENGKEAYQILNDLEKKYRKDGRPTLIKATRTLQKNMYPEALDTYGTAVSKDLPKAENLQAYYEMAYCYYMLDNNEDALEYLEKAQQLDPLFYKSSFLKAVIYFYNNNFDLAAENMFKAENNVKNDNDYRACIYHGLAAIHFHKKEMEFHKKYAELALKEGLENTDYNTIFFPTNL